MTIQGTQHTNPERLLTMLESKPGDQFDAERVERDARRLAAGGDDTRADYPLQRGQSGAALVLAVCCATAWVIFINCRAARPTS